MSNSFIKPLKMGSPSLTFLRKIKRILRTTLNKFSEHKEWRKRISDAVSAPDNKFIERVQNAGKVEGNIQYMHNGIKIYRESYYGKEIMKLLKKNKGVHEPQEERVFQEVLLNLKQDSPIMLELGAYWGFYSMWFLSVCKDGSAYLVEPNKNNLEFGKENFKLNNLQGNFLQGLIDSESDDKTSPAVFTVNDLVKFWSLPQIDILHADIQGYELKMLEGINSKYLQDNVRYLFISTHSNELHNACRDFISGHKFNVIADVSLDESYSYDGILIALNSKYPGIERISLHKKN